MTENKTDKALAKITKDRTRTNLLKESEQRFIAYLVQRIPPFITSDMLTAIGLFGSFVTFMSFVLAYHYGVAWLLFGILGFFINWFGDSTDGRVAYYRGTPRKWYGFSLDIVVDWFTDVLIGCGFIYYMDGLWQWAGFAFILLYGWSIIMALLQYKITDKYLIDSSFMGPTEVRIVISLLLVLEIIVPGILKYLGVIVCILLLFFNVVAMRNLLKMGDERDAREREEKLRKAEVEA